MRSVSVRLADLERVTIPIGFEGENDYTHVHIDCKKVFDEDNSFVPTLALVSPEGEKYPGIVTRDGDIVTWVVSASDLTKRGAGELQLAFTKDNVIGKTYVARTRVERSITPDGEAPSVIENFIIEAGAIVNGIPQAIEDAIDDVMGDITAEAETLQPGSSASASFDSETKTFTFGIPTGAKGEKGDKGDPGAKGDKGDKGDPGDPGDVIDDTAGTGVTNRAWSANKLTSELAKKEDKPDLVVTFSNLDLNAGTVTADKTPDEVTAAYVAGKTVRAYLSGLVTPPLELDNQRISQYSAFFMGTISYSLALSFSGYAGESTWRSATSRILTGSSTEYRAGQMPIKYLADPADAQDAATKNYVDGAVGGLIDDTAGIGDTDVTYSADKLATDHSSLLNAIERLDNSKAPIIIDSASGAIATFPDGADGLPLESLVVGIEPVQSGTGDPSPSNVRPLIGWTGCNVTRTGKNLLNSDIKAYFNDNMYFGGHSSGNVPDGTFILPAGTYTVSASEIMTGIYTFDSSGSSLEVAYNKTKLTFTNPKTQPFLIRFYKASTTEQGFSGINMWMELGSTATAYEPYQGETYPITFDSAGTVYGGTVNLVTGKLIVDRVTDIITKDSAWYSFSTGTGNSSAVVQLSEYQNVKYITGSSSWNGAISSTGKESQNYWINTRENEVPSDGDMCFAYSSTGQLRVHRTDIATITDLDTFKANFPDTQVCYFLATPIVYDLPSIEPIRTLLGLNNVFADTGNVSVDYRADTKLFVEKTEVSGVQDVKVNGTSVVTDGVANVPVASDSTFGVVKVSTGGTGIAIDSNNKLKTQMASDSYIKGGSDANRVIVPYNQDKSVFYGLAKLAGADMASLSSVTVGQYPETQKSAIAEMLNGAVSVSGTTPSITAKAGVRYICGEVSTLTITVPASGCIDVVFTSGSTATVLTVTPTKTGVTAVKWANGFDPSSLEANTTYEINIMDGCLGVAAAWT